jgi:hypothetical protein
VFLSRDPILGVSIDIGRSTGNANVQFSEGCLIGQAVRGLGPLKGVILSCEERDLVPRARYQAPIACGFGRPRLEADKRSARES